jgi:DNA replication initiation complex subunit (GINS family)
LAETMLEEVKRHLDSELESGAILPLPSDFYSRLSSYCQKLKRSSGSGNSEVAVRLIARQTSMIDSMVRQLVAVRAQKASQQDRLLQLLPEERYVCSAQQKFQRRLDTFTQAVSGGQPSFIEFAHRMESERNVTVRFTKHVNELIGLDARHYGPYETDDVASIPAASAEILVAGGDAVEIYTREEA